MLSSMSAPHLMAHPKNSSKHHNLLPYVDQPGNLYQIPPQRPLNDDLNNESYLSKASISSVSGDPPQIKPQPPGKESTTLKPPP